MNKPILRGAYMPQLDGLRALAVASVAYSHWVPAKYHLGLPFGSAGVQLFFVLSGFLITNILLGCRKYDDPAFTLRSFYARRALRIFPLFYGVILIAALLNIEPVRETLIWHLTYMSNIYFLSIQSWNGPISHFWSLAVEEQFYLFWPAVILFVPKIYLRISLLILVFIGIASQFLIPLFFPSYDFLYVLPFCNFDALGLGALLAFVHAQKFKGISVDAFIWALPAFVIFMLLNNLHILLPLSGQIQHLMMIIFFAWVIDNAAKGFNGYLKKLLEFPLLLYLGRISYGIYVLHNFAGIPVSFAANILNAPSISMGVLRLIMLTLFTIVGASISWHFFEAPFTRLKSIFPYKNPKIVEGV